MKQILALFTALLLCCGNSTAQAPKIVKLKPAEAPVALQQVYINTVTDDREDTGNIGTMRAGITNKIVPVDLSGGAATAIGQFIGNHTIRPLQADTFSLHILKLQVSESRKGLQEQAELNTTYAFFAKGKKIVDYSGNYTARTGADASVYIGKLVSQSVEQVLKEFDGWWSINRERYGDPGQQEVKVTVLLKSQATDPDHIGYDSSRPLRIEDFNGKPDKLSLALAATYSGFSLQYQLSSDQKSVAATISLLPYFDKNRSWMKPGGQNAYVLQHEQLHFDIAALKTYELATALRSLKYNSATFKEAVDNLQRQYSKEAEALQAAYDEETAHGAQKDRQRQWTERIRAELSSREAAAAD